MPRTAQTLVDEMRLDAFFDETRLSYDFRAGMVWNPAKTRLCLLSTDFLDGVYRSLADEAGPAWAVIFKTCGVIWGGRVMRRLDRECQLLLNCSVKSLPLSLFLQFLRGYFTFHGWGALTLDVTRARETGVVAARLEDSPFAEVIRDPEEMADSMIAGILAGMLSDLSGQTLDCLQTECISKGAEASRFLITGAERTKGYAERIKAGMTHEAVMESI
jgi:hypothetical protein